MDKTTKRLIAQIVSKVLETPTAGFEVCGNDYGELRFSFFYGPNMTRIARDGNENWSAYCDITEDNLRYLLAEIGKNRP